MPDNGDRSRTPEGVFGSELRYYRERAGLSQVELAALSHCSNDVISKIEKGKRPPAEGFPARLDAIPQLDTRSGLARLWGWLRESARHRAYPGWFDRWPDYEAKAKTLRTFEMVMVPGLQQTEGYARAVLRTQVMTTDEKIEEMVRARIARQEMLVREDPPMFWGLIDEGALRRPVGGKRVMRDQLDKLIEAAHLPNVVLQV